ncbi:MAG TPA: TonB-dependent receptor [Caulobacteraceae bacterium]|jgi:hypothetical protein
MALSRPPVAKLAARAALATALLSSAAPAVFADPPPPAPAPASASHTVTPYPASFFASMGLDTAYDMVLRLPGFAFDDGAVVRGFADSAGNVLIDGARPASKTDDLIAVLRRIPVAQVERIDVIRGGAPGIDMQNKTLVANVIRKRARGLSGAVSVGGYKPNDIPFDPLVRLQATWRGDDRSLEGSLQISRFHDGTQASGPHEILGPTGQLLDASSMHNEAVGWQNIATAAYETPLGGGRLRVNLTLEDQPYDVVNLDDFKVAGRELDRSRSDQSDAELGQHYDRDLTGHLKLELLGLQHVDRTVSTSLFDTDTDHQDFAVTDHSAETIVRGVLHWRPSGALTVDGGGEFAFNWLNTHTVFTDNQVAVAVPAGDVTVEEKRGEAFATATWRAAAPLVVEAGLRLEVSTISSSGEVALAKTLTYPKPRLLVTWTPDPEDQVRLRVEREVGQLDFTNFVANAALNLNGVVAGNPNLVPQQDWAFEAAYDRHFWKDAVVSLTVRHLILQDVIDRAPVFGPSGAFDEPANIGGGSENDLVGSFTVPLDRLGLAGAAIRGQGTWRFSRVTDPTTGQPRQISGQYPLNTELHFSQDLPKWKLSWGVDDSIGFAQTFFRFDEIDTNHTGTYQTLFVEYKPRPDLSVRFELDDRKQIYDITRQVFAGPRNADPLLLTDFQRRKFGVISFIRLRKTFG